MNPNFNSGFLQEAFRLDQQNFQDPGNPNYFTDQQIRQNQATLGQIQNTGAYQQNQLQQVQLIRQMQDIQRAGEEERIRNALYPSKDDSGNTFFATLRQIEALKSVRVANEQTLADESLRNRILTEKIATMQKQDSMLADRQGSPKIADFRDNVLNNINVRIMRGGADGRLALKELEELQPDKELSKYMDSTGQVRESPELRAAVEKLVADSRESARGTHLAKIRDSAIKELTSTQMDADELMELRPYMTAEKFNEAVALRGRVQKYTLESDYQNPDPVAISNLSMEVGSFNVGQLRKLREAREGAKVVQEANPTLAVTEVTSGPKGVEVKAEKEKSTAAPGTAEVRNTREKQAVDIEEKIVQNEADIQVLKKRKESGAGEADLTTKNKDGTSTGKNMDDLVQENKVLEQKLLDLKKTQGMPLSGKDRQVEQAVSGQGSASVPNVLQRSPQASGTAPASASTRVNTPSVYQPAVAVPGNSAPVAVLRFVKQADGKIVGTFTTPPSTGTNKTAKPK